MIYAITPNPALDLGGLVERLVPEEKAYVQDETRAPGGNAINAARMIRRLGAPVVATGFLGGGVGEEIEHFLDHEQVAHQFVHITGNTRINVTISNHETHLQTRLSFPGPRIRAPEKAMLLRQACETAEPTLVVIGGSLPPGFTPADLRRLILGVRKRGLPCLVDVPGPVLREVLSARPSFIKPNLVEFQELIGRKVTTIDAVRKVARTLLDQVPLICVSSIEGGALLITRQATWFGRIPPVRISSTVGAGDSMVGAISARLWQELRRDRRQTPRSGTKSGMNSAKKAKPGSGARIEPGPEATGELLRWGLAAACATLTHTGTRLGSAREVRRYLPEIRLRRIC